MQRWTYPKQTIPWSKTKISIIQGEELLVLVNGRHQRPGSTARELKLVEKLREELENVLGKVCRKTH